MKKIISKILIIFIIFIMMFEFCFSSNISYALDISDEFINSLTSLAGGIVAYGLWFKRIIVISLSTMFTEIFTISFAASCGVNWGGIGSLGPATPYDIFFNKFILFDVDFFDTTTRFGAINDIRAGVAEWFYIMRNIAASILLCVLIYVGIRMAISTIADEKAKYKKMLFDWCCSLALIFVLQYIAVFTISVNNVIVDALRQMYKQTDAMSTAILQIATQAVMPVGLGSIVATFVYAMIVFQTIAFMIAYMRRVLKVGFLLVISPLISLTYSIDKIGDGKAQALNSWLKEFVYTILIQPFHCIIYMAFVKAAIELLSVDTILGSFINIFTGEYNQLANGVVVILCLKFINDGETAIRKIFNFQDDGNLTSLAAGAAVGLAMVNKAKGIGEGAAKGVNALREKGITFKNSYGKFAQNTKIGKNFDKMFQEKAKNLTSSDSKLMKALKAGKNLSTKANNIKANVGKWTNRKGGFLSKARDFKGKISAKIPDKVKQSRTLKRATSWAKKALPTKANFKNSLPGALAMMGFAMSYATGSSGVMSAIGTAGALEEGTEKFFDASLGTQTQAQADASKTAENAGIDQEKQKRNDAVRNAAKKGDSAGELPSEYATNDSIDKIAAQYAADKKTVAGAEPGKETEEQKAAQERIDKLDEDGVLKEIDKRAELETDEGKEAVAKKTRMKQLTPGHNSSEKEVTKKADALLDAIREYKMKTRTQDLDTDSDMSNRLSTSEASSADKMMDTLRLTIDRSVIDGSGGSFDMSRLLQEQMGLMDDGSDAYQSVMRTALAYRSAVAERHSESIYEKWEKLSGGRETLFYKTCEARGVSSEYEKQPEAEETSE